MNKNNFTDKTLLQDIATKLGYEVTNIATTETGLILMISNGNKFYIANSGGFGYYPSNQRWHTALFKDKIRTASVLEKMGYKCLSSYNFLSEEHQVETLKEELLSLKITFPVILKPSEGMRGRGIVYIKNHPQLLKASVAEHRKGNNFCIQQIVKDVEYRILFTNGEATIVHSKNHCYVTGDGTSKVCELIKNIKFPNGELDIEFLNDELVNSNQTLNTILEKGVKIKTHLTSTTVDNKHNEVYFKKDIPPNVSTWTNKLAKGLSATVLGVDIFASDITNPETFQIIEINSNPGFDYIANKFEGYEQLKEMWRGILSSYFVD